MSVTKISDLINPTVMADMISGKLESKIVVTPFAKVDDTLQGVPGDTIKVPQYSYIGDATDVAEGVEVGTVKLGVSAVEATVKKAMKAVELSDEAVLSGFGNPVGEANNQLAMSIASKIDADALSALEAAQKIKFTDEPISYGGVVDAADLFQEEVSTAKVIFLHPSQVTRLRKDSNFISNEKYNNNVIMTGEIGRISNCRVVASRRVKKNSEPLYIRTTEAPLDWATNYTSYYTASTSEGVTTYSAVTGQSAPDWAEGTYYKKVNANGMYLNPIVHIETERDTEDVTPALTIFVKRDTNVETERKTSKRTTEISVDKFYTVALTNQSKVVLAGFGV